MKIPSYLLYFFAGLGVIFAIFLSCSVASEDTVSDTSATGIGKYQMQVLENTGSTYNNLYILDTENGTVQVFTRPTPTSDYTLVKTFETQ